MDFRNHPSRPQRATKPVCNATRLSQWAKSNPTTQTRLLAYELGAISRSKMRKEASKTAPRLHKLVGHAAIFDNATKFITEHINDDSAGIGRYESANCKEVQDVTYSLKTQGSIKLTHKATFKGYAQLKSKPESAVVVTTTLLSTQDIDSEDTESDSSSDSEDDYIYDRDDRWLASFCEDDDEGGRLRSDWEFVGTYSKQLVDSISAYNPSNDDLLLWSQQPRVLSEKQEANLFVEAFG